MIKIWKIYYFNKFTISINLTNKKIKFKAIKSLPTLTGSFKKQ